jgi:LacI family transcriptional regulator
VLNDQIDQRIPISTETRRRVLSAIAELGYVPDARGQSLRSGSTKTIGVLLPLYENPHFWRILRGISSEAEAAGYSLLLSHSSLTAEQEHQSLRELAQQRVDGLILLIGFRLLPDSILDQLRQLHRPVVELSSTPSIFDCVIDGYQDGTQALMEHLFQLGHQRIGFIYGVVDEQQGHDRLLPYREMLNSRGVTLDRSLFRECGPYLEDGYRAALELLRQPNRPTALLVINDLLALATLRAAADLGLHVPEDVSIAGFDDIPFANYSTPRLTTVSAEAEQDGRYAVQLLLKRLEEPERPQEFMRGSSRLMIRESTGPAPVL